MDDYDYDDEYYFDDPNLYLPNHFLTCFDAERLPVYAEAISRYAVIDPDHQLEIDFSGRWNSMKEPALLCYKRGDLSKFWHIFDEVNGVFQG